MKVHSKKSPFVPLKLKIRRKLNFGKLIGTITLATQHRMLGCDVLDSAESDIISLLPKSGPQATIMVPKRS